LARPFHQPGFDAGSSGLATPLRCSCSRAPYNLTNHPMIAHSGAQRPLQRPQTQYPQPVLDVLGAKARSQRPGPRHGADREGVSRTVRQSPLARSRCRITKIRYISEILKLQGFSCGGERSRCGEQGSRQGVFRLARDRPRHRASVSSARDCSWRTPSREMPSLSARSCSVSGSGRRSRSGRRAPPAGGQAGL
jgi:hypothetical protein